MIKSYVINLPYCRERRKSVLAECARYGLEPDVVPGVDGRSLPESELRRAVFDPDRNSLGKAEIGCTLSHLGVYRDMLEKGVPIALILEDDSVFSRDPCPLLAEFERRPGNGADAYLLTHRSNRYIASVSRRIGDFTFYRGWNGVGCNGYVVTNRAAARLCAFQTPIRCMCDDWKVFLIYDVVRFHVCDKEIVGLHPELGDVSSSLLEDGRLTGDDPKKKRYFRDLRRRAPFILKAKYLLRKIRYWRSLRRQEGLA